MATPSIADYLVMAPHPSRRQGGTRLSRNVEVRETGGDVAITIVTVVFNARDALPRTLDSVFDQGYEALEYLVVDGGSTDGTLDVVRSYEDRLALWISEPDQGIYDAMNKGIAHAEGRVVGLLNAGDTYLPGALRTVGDAVRVHGDAGIYYGDLLARYLDLGVELTLFANPRALPYTCSVLHPSMFVPLDVYRRDGLYSLDYELAADYAYAASQYLAGRRFHDLGRPITAFANDGRSSSRKGFFQCRREMIAFHRSRKSSHALGVALYAGLEIVLWWSYQLFLPVLGARRADALKRRFLKWRSRRQSRGGSRA